jgi:uncharacterized protein YraI
MIRIVFFHRIVVTLLAALILASCAPAVESTEEPLVPPTATATQQSQANPTETAAAQPTDTSEVVQETEVVNTSTCTILQDLNMRFGPGTAYRPPIRVLPENSVVTPLGFAPQGIPGGSWAYVSDAVSQDEGWVSAGSQYISCNVELSTLPPVAFGTPPTPPLPQGTRTSDPDGNGFCIDPNSGYQCVGIFSEESLFEFQILSNGVELGENDGVDRIEINVNTVDGSTTIYGIDEFVKDYCIFGGNGPCTPWIYEDGVYKWGAGGPTAEPGEYEMEVFAYLNGQDSRWAVTFTLTLP